MPPAPLELAVLGCGRIAAAHARTLSRAAVPVALSFASRDSDRGRRFAERHGGRSHASYTAAIASPRTRAVLVCTPPATHLDLAREALAAGRDVIVEKPAFMSSDELDAAAAAAEEGGARLLVAENYFYKPLRARLAGWIASGAVGRVLSLSVDATKTQAISGWRADPAAAGGPLLESGVHWIDFLANAGLEVESVAGAASAAASQQARSLSVLVRYAGGAAGVLHLSWEGYAMLGGARLSHLHGTDGTVTFESNGAFALLRGRRRGAWAPDPRDASGLRPMWRDFLGVLAGGGDPRFDLARARRDLALVEEIAAVLDAAGEPSVPGAARPRG